MAQTYTRQSTLTDGDTITASLFNNEYNQIVNAFAYSSTDAATTGHRHDGSAAQGGNIPIIGDLNFFNKIVVDGTNNRWGIFVEVAGGPVEQVRIQDGAIVPVTTNDIDLGTGALQFKDIFIDGTANIDSLVLSSGSTVTAILDEDDLVSDSATALATQQSIKAYVDAQVTAQDLDIVGDTGTDAIDLDSETLTFTGGTGITSVVTAGTVTHNIDSTVATLTGTQTLTNKTITSPDIDGGTVDGADITVGAAKTLDVSAGTLTLADNQISGDKVEGGTIAAITITAMTGTLQTAAQPNVTSLGTIASLVATTADINGGTIDGTTLGATTPASVAATTLSTTGTATFGGAASAAGLTSTAGLIIAAGGVFYLDGGSNTYIREDAADNMVFYTAGTQRLGLGPTGAATFSGNVQVNGSINTNLQSLSAWTANTRAIELTTYGAVSSNDNTGAAALSVNAYESSDSAWNRVAGTNAARFQTNYLGEHKWSNAIAAAGGTAISWVDQMTLSAAGALTTTGAATFGGNATVNGGNAVIGTGGGGNGLGALISKGAVANFYEAYDGTKTMIAGTDAGNDFVKIGSLSAHPVGFVVGNGEKMRIDASGNLLAGTSVTKGSRVHSSGASASASPTLGSATDTSLLLSNSDVTYGMNFGVINNGNGWIQQHSNTGTASAYNLLLQPVGGNVGIGTSSPAEKLDISQSVNNSVITKVTNTNSGDLATARVEIHNNDSSFGQLTTYSSGFGYPVLGSSAANWTFIGSSGANSNGLKIGTLTADPIVFGTNDTERMRLDASGNLLVGGTTTPVLAGTGPTALSLQGLAPVIDFRPTTGDAHLLYASPDNSLVLFNQTDNREDLRVDGSGRALFGHSAAIQGTKVEISAVTDGGALGLFGRASDNLSYIGFYQNGVATRTAMIQANSAAGLQFIGGSGGTLQMTLDTSGNLVLADGLISISSSVAADANNNMFTVTKTAVASSLLVNAVSLQGYSSAVCAVQVGQSSGLGRSINAGGTINASGADYAEYEQNNGLTISKGSVVGFKADGTLTLTFSEAVRFAIKSTNPSYVGGDTWGTEEQVGIRPVKPADDADAEVVAQYEADLTTFETALEAARQLVDRIAYSGKVPVNVQGAIAGDYIIAVAAEDGSIGGQAVSDPDFAQYKLAVGRVNRILDDGRAEVAVIIH
jgi:hypothetical protein